MSPEDIEDLFKRTDGVVLPENGDEDEATLTESEKQYRIAHLRAILLEAHNAWVSGSEELDQIAEKLGDGSRHGESIFDHIAFLTDPRDLYLMFLRFHDPLTSLSKALWRSPIGASGILNFFLGILPTPGLRPLLRSHALRLIGNSCADTGKIP